MATSASLIQLQKMIGREVSVSDWLEVTQERINRFAEATGDRQWIHVDPERASKESPYKATIAHGFLTLSLLSVMAAGVRLPNTRMAINYGLERVRFPSAVPSGSMIRSHFTLKTAERNGEALRVVWAVTVERQGSEKPCCVAEWVVQYYMVV